jgi:hypothetical protein
MHEARLSTKSSAARLAPFGRFHPERPSDEGHHRDTGRFGSGGNRQVGTRDFYGSG